MYLGTRGNELFELLLMKARELGRAPSFAEVQEDNRLPHPNDYAYYFGSFSEAAKETGIKIHFENLKNEPKKTELAKSGSDANKQMQKEQSNGDGTEGKGEEPMHEDSEWRKAEIAEKKKTLERMREKKKTLKEDMINELAQYMQEHDGCLPEFGEPLPEGTKLQYSLLSYRTAVGGGNWDEVVKIVTDRYETLELERMIAEDEAKGTNSGTVQPEPEVVDETAETEAEVGETMPNETDVEVEPEVAPETVEAVEAENEAYEAEMEGAKTSESEAVTEAETEVEDVAETEEVADAEDSVPKVDSVLNDSYLVVTVREWGEEKFKAAEGPMEVEKKEGDAMTAEGREQRSAQLMKELVDFSVQEMRLPRGKKRGNNPSDEGNLPNSIEVYKTELGNGSWSEVQKLIIANLPSHLYFDSQTYAIKERQLTRGGRKAKAKGHATVKQRNVTEEEIANVLKEQDSFDEKFREGLDKQLNEDIAEMMADAETATEPEVTAGAVDGTEPEIAPEPVLEPDESLKATACDSAEKDKSNMLRLPKIKSYEKTMGNNYLLREPVDTSMATSENKMRSNAFIIRHTTDKNGREALEVICNADEVAFERVVYDNGTCSIKILC